MFKRFFKFRLLSNSFLKVYNLSNIFLRFALLSNNSYFPYGNSLTMMSDMWPLDYVISKKPPM
jgi:hypothetical protein